jgi:hypothetical protein
MILSASSRRARNSILFRTPLWNTCEFHRVGISGGSFWRGRWNTSVDKRWIASFHQHPSIPGSSVITHSLPNPHELNWSKLRPLDIHVREELDIGSAAKSCLCSVQRAAIWKWLLTNLSNYYSVWSCNTNFSKFYPKSAYKVVLIL